MTTIAIMYPSWWDPNHEANVAELSSLGPDVEVLVEPYEEPRELRSQKGIPPFDDVAHLAPELTEAQREVYAQADAIVTLDIPANIAELAPNLRWVQAVGAGTAHLASCGLAEAGITLTSSAGANATGIAEFVIARILGVYKNVRGIEAAQRDHNWEAVFGEEVAGRTMGLVGFGEINRRVAERARAFELDVSAMRRSTSPSELLTRLYRPEELHEMLSANEIIVAAVPESPETESMMDADAFAAMQPNSVFVNVGRGALVVEEALDAALRDGHLRAAIIDVTRTEPLPADSPLWTAPNIYISGHCAAAPLALFQNLHKIVIDNLTRFRAGDELRNVQ